MVRGGERGREDWQRVSRYEVILKVGLSKKGWRRSEKEEQGCEGWCTLELVPSALYVIVKSGRTLTKVESKFEKKKWGNRRKKDGGE